jgi:hypothetical protein
MHLPVSQLQQLWGRAHARPTQGSTHNARPSRLLVWWRVRMACVLVPAALLIV